MPELWQLLFAPSSVKAYEVPEYLQAMLSYVVEEASRVKWNNEQKEWDVNSSEWVVPGSFAFRPFDWSDEEDGSERLPNVEFSGVEFSFYKRFGRGMSVSEERNEREWREWFDAFLAAVRKQEKRAY